ncbi:MAG: hypothetical protein HRU24_02185 [Gammaproteobacteria bacterium]|nr:hypothetical protein [Gammaproteobacteria bacterium]
MNIEIFIEQKSKQLVFYTSQLLANAIPFSEVKIFSWDILEEWNKLDFDDPAISDYEHAFWHLIFLLQCWPEEKQNDEKAIRSSLNHYCNYLSHHTNEIPADCIGMRP